MAGDYDSLFLDIDDNNSGYIDFNNLMDYLQKNGIFPYEEEVIYILRRLDQDDDGRISLLELQKELTPKGSYNLLSSGQKYVSDNFRDVRDRFKSSASKNYPYEPIRRSASPMKPQIMKSPLKAGFNNNHQQSFNESQTKIRSYKETTSYESPKKKLDFDAKYNNYNSPARESQKVGETDYRNLKAEIEKELSYSKIRTSPYKNKNSVQETASFNNTNFNLNSNYSASKPPFKNSPDYRTSSNIANIDSYSSQKKAIINEMILNESYSSQKKVLLNETLFNEIAQYLKLIIRYEREINYLRQDLTLRPDFNAGEFFNCFDKLMKGYLNPEEINEFFECFDIFMTGEKNIFMQRFCKTKEIFKFL